MLAVAPRRQTEEGLIKLPVGLPPEQYEWLRESAFRRRVPMAEIVRQALREHRERAEPGSGLDREGTFDEGA